MDAVVAINGSPITSRPSGLAVYTYEVGRRIAGAFDARLVWRGKIENELINGDRYPSVLPTKKQHLGGRLYHNFLQVPLAARKMHADLLFCPSQIDVGWGCGVRQIITVHDVTPMKFPEYHQKQKYWYSHVLARILGTAAQIIVPSESTRDDLHAIGIETAIDVIPNGVDHARFFPRSEASINVIKKRFNIDDYLLYVGNIFPHKNIPRLIAAHDVSGVDVPLVLAGQRRDCFMAPIEAAMSAHRNKHLIRFIDYISDEELPALYAGALAFVFPSLYEGFGLPPLEAMACGAPVITSNAGSLPEVVRDAGITVDPYSIEELGAAIVDICADSVKRTEYSARSIARAQLFTWDKCGADTVRVIERLLS